MRVVLDTGVMIAALITKGTPPNQIYQAWRKRRFELITSEWQLDEFRRMSRYPRLHRFARMFEKRLVGYRAIGYRVTFPPAGQPLKLFLPLDSATALVDWSEELLIESGSECGETLRGALEYGPATTVISIGTKAPCPDRVYRHSTAGRRCGKVSGSGLPGHDKQPDEGFL